MTLCKMMTSFHNQEKTETENIQETTLIKSGMDLSFSILFGNILVNEDEARAPNYTNKLEIHKEENPYQCVSY